MNFILFITLNKNVGFYLNSKVYQEKELEKSKESSVSNENGELIYEDILIDLIK